MDKAFYVKTDMWYCLRQEYIKGHKINNTGV